MNNNQGNAQQVHVAQPKRSMKIKSNVKGSTSVCA